MRYYYFLFIFFIMLTGCLKDKKPGNIIPDDKFVAFMVDIHMADGLTRVYNYTDIEEIFPTDTSLFIMVYQKHGITEAMIDSTLKYYVDNDPKKLHKLCTKALNQLKQIEAQINEEKKPKNRKPKQDTNKKEK